MDTATSCGGEFHMLFMCCVKQNFLLLFSLTEQSQLQVAADL